MITSGRSNVGFFSDGEQPVQRDPFLTDAPEQVPGKEPTAYHAPPRISARSSVPGSVPSHSHSHPRFSTQDPRLGQESTPPGSPPLYYTNEPSRPAYIQPLSHLGMSLYTSEAAFTGFILSLTIPSTTFSLQHTLT